MIVAMHAVPVVAVVWPSRLWPWCRVSHVVPVVAASVVAVAVAPWTPHPPCRGRDVAAWFFIAVMWLQHADEC